MRRRKFTIPMSIILFLASVLVGTYLVRKRILERHMIAALEMQDQKMIRSLLNSWPCPVNAVGKDDLTPLFWAVNRRKTDVALLAIAKGADVNVRERTGTTPLHRKSHQADILFRHTFAGVEYGNNDLRPFHRLQGFDDAELLDGFVHPGLTPHAGRIDQQVFTILALERNGNAVPGRTGLVVDDQSVLPNQPVDQGR